MRSCEEYRELISCLIDGELSGEDEAELRAHIASCEECREMYEAFRDISASLAETLAEPPEALAENVMFRIRGAELTHKRRARRLTAYAAVAACFVLVMVGAGRAGLFGGAKGAAPAAAAPAAQAMEDRAAYAVAATGESAGEDAEANAESYFAETDAAAPAAPAAPVPSTAPEETAGGVQKAPEPLPEPEAASEPAPANEAVTAFPMCTLSNAAVYSPSEGYSIYAGKNAYNDGTPIVTFTEPEELALLEELLRPGDAPAEAADKAGEPLYIIELEDEDGELYVLEVWIENGALLCRSGPDCGIYRALGTAEELEKLLEEKMKQ